MHKCTCLLMTGMCCHAHHHDVDNNGNANSAAINVACINSPLVIVLSAHMVCVLGEL